MPRFDNRDVAFDAPEGWEDRTIIAFEAPKAAHSHGVYPTSISLILVEKKPVSLSTFATQQVAHLATALPKFELVSQQNVTFGGLPAIELLFNWQLSDGGVTQRMTIFERVGKVWSFTCSALRGAFDQNVPAFDRIARSIKFADGAPAPSSGGGGFPPSSGGGGFPPSSGGGGSFPPRSSGGGSLPPLPEKPRGW